MSTIRFHYSVVDGRIYQASDLDRLQKTSNQFPLLFEKTQAPEYHSSLVIDNSRTVSWQEDRKIMKKTFPIPDEPVILSPVMQFFAKGTALEVAKEIDQYDPLIINLPENLAKWVKVENINDPFKGNGKVWKAGDYFVRMDKPHRNIDFEKYREMARSILSQYGEVHSVTLYIDYLTLQRAKELIGKKVLLGYDSTNVGQYTCTLVDINIIKEHSIENLCLGVRFHNDEHCPENEVHYSFYLFGYDFIDKNAIKDSIFCRGSGAEPLFIIKILE